MSEDPEILKMDKTPEKPIEYEHLYISKRSPLRQKIEHLLQDQIQNLLRTIFDKIDIKKLSDNQMSSVVRNSIGKVWDEIRQNEIFFEHQKQVTYFVVDHLILGYLNVFSIDSNEAEEVFLQYIHNLVTMFPDYIVAHEIAALGWGNEVISEDIVFEFISQLDLSTNHQYHLLGEMSRTYPLETITYVKENVDNLFEPSLLEKIIAKAIRDRKKQEKQRQLGRFELVLNRENLEEILDQREIS